MTTEEHLLVCLAEECVEVAKEVSKALRFGLDDTDPTIPGSPFQRVRIVQELYDLMALVEMLEERGTITRYREAGEAAIRAKKSKVMKFLDYARERGALAYDFVNDHDA